MYRVEDLAINCFDNQVKINGKFVPARPFPFYGPFGLWLRIKDAYMVLIGKADAVIWPEDEV